MATIEDAFRGLSRGRARRAWVFPVLAVMAGSAASVGLAAVLSMTKTSLPAMAAVDEIQLVVPAGQAAPARGGGGARSVGLAGTDWPADREARRARIRGHVVDVGGEAPMGPAIVKAEFRNDTGPVESFESAAVEDDAAGSEFASDHNIRWFNARPARPARTIWMTVTGYSPDERSCGDSADGLTATMHSVTTNAMKLVAADPTVLPYGSMVSVPGYDAESIVPVLDCGGAIKGDRLDLLFPTHEEALKWGRQRVLVTVWEYADGKPAENPRKVR